MKINIKWITDNFFKYSHAIKVTIIALVILVAFLFTMCGNKDQGGIAIETQGPGQEGEEFFEIEHSGTIIVDVGGAVNNPGIVELPEGSRVYQAIEKAGGVTRDGDLDQINQAILLNDCDKLYIPTKEEGNDQILASNNPPQGVGLVSRNASSQNQEGKVNINTASQQELETLNGIGPVTANKIIDYRASNGRFDTIENIMEVPGIGEKTYAGFKDKICI